MIRAVAFDVDGTLYPNYRMYVNSFPFALRHPRIGLAFKRARKRIRGIRPIKDIYQTQAELFSHYLGVTVKKGRFLIDHYIYGEYITFFAGIKLFPAVREIVEKFKSMGLKIGVLSDFPVAGKLSYLGLDDLWDCALSAEETHYLKPNPEPFEALSQKLDVALPEILYIGNHYEYDVLGACSMGMKTAHLARSPAKDTKADFTFTDYRTLGQWVRGQA